MNKEKETETETVTLMVRRYCCGVHWTRGEALCPACNALLEYARERRDRCRHSRFRLFCQYGLNFPFRASSIASSILGRIVMSFTSNTHC